MAGLSDAIGELFVKVRPDTSTFGAEVAAGTTAATSGSGAGVAAARKGGLVLGAAAIGGMVKGISDFSEFERGLNEVFTLIPDAGEKMYGTLEGQVKEFAAATGTMPQEVIKPLYDAISAGVPADNVFTFLESANEFAKAGAVDLAASVDALTTGVNAFGLGAEGAGRVSDSLFTAVKLGKTTVDELSRSLFQVAPIAASFGVSVEDVSAGFATLTAQGTPTKVAATQIKSAIAELGKQGTKAGDAFAEITGQRFPDFIKGGGTMVEAAGLMAAGADDAGVSLIDLFGSIEAGQAFVGLAADLDKSQANLDAVNASAGATGVAFEQMEKGIGPSMDKIKARLSVAFLEIGTALAPTVEKAAAAFAEFATAISKVPGPVLALGLAILAGAGALLVLVGPILKVIKLMKMMSAVMAANPWILLAIAVVAIGVLIYKNWDAIAKFLSDTWKSITGGITSAWNAIVDFFKKWVNRVKEIFNIFFKGDFTGISDWAEDSKIVEVLFNIRDGIIGFKDDVVGAFMDVYNGVVGVFTSIIGFLKEWWRLLLIVVTGPIGIIVNLIIVHWETIKTVTSEAWNFISGIISVAVDTIVGIVQGLWDKMSPIFELIKNLMITTWETIKVVTTEAWYFIGGIISNAVDAIVGFVQGMWDKMSPIFDLVKGALGLVGEAFDLLMAGADIALGLLKTIVGGAVDFIIARLNDLKDVAKEALGPLGDVVGFAGKVGGGALGFAGKLIGKASGGPVVPGQDYLVGEEGPEMVRFGSRGTVIPAAQTAAMMGGGGGSVTINMGGFTVANDMDIVETARAIARETERQLRAKGSR